MNTTDRNARSSLGRALALIATGALLLALVPAAAAFADHGGATPPGSRGTDRVCPAPGGNHDFPDVAPATTHGSNVECAGGHDLVQGFDDGDGNPDNNPYGPALTIQRDQMATFIANYVETAIEATLPGADTNAFDDDDGNTHEGNINKLAAAEIIRGTEEARTYEPGDNVSRAQMATYIANADDYIDDGEVNQSLPPDDDNNYFGDDDLNVHHDSINRLAGVGVVAGTSSTAHTYSPNVDVSREEMATFIMQDADYKNEQGLFPDGGDGGDPTDPDRPLLTAAAITIEGANSDVWDEVGDVLTLTFNEAVNDTDGDNMLGEAQVEAILGTGIAYATPTGAPDSAVTIFSDGTDQVTLTISGANLTEGVAVLDSVPGTLNHNIRDLAGNRQGPNPSPATVS